MMIIAIVVGLAYAMFTGKGAPTTAAMTRTTHATPAPGRFDAGPATR